MRYSYHTEHNHWSSVQAGDIAMMWYPRLPSDEPIQDIWIVLGESMLSTLMRRVRFLAGQNSPSSHSDGCRTVSNGHSTFVFALWLLACPRVPDNIICSQQRPKRGYLNVFCNGVHEGNEKQCRKGWALMHTEGDGELFNVESEETHWCPWCDIQGFRTRLHRVGRGRRLIPNLRKWVAADFAFRNVSRSSDGWHSIDCAASGYKGAMVFEQFDNVTNPAVSDAFKHLHAVRQQANRATIRAASRASLTLPEWDCTAPLQFEGFFFAMTHLIYQFYFHTSAVISLDESFGLALLVLKHKWFLR